MRSEDTSRRIMDVAEDVFAAKGFAGARTKEIAAAAGVTSAMIHYYFATKERLYQAVLDRIRDDLAEAVDRVVPEQKTIEEMLEAFLHAYFDYVSRHPSFSRLTSMALGTKDQKYFERMIVRFFRPLFRAGVEFIRNGIAAGVFRPVDPEQFLISFYGTTISYFSDARFLSVLLGRATTTRRAVDGRKEALVDLLFAGLGAKRPERRPGGLALRAPRTAGHSHQTGQVGKGR